MSTLNDFPYIVSDLDGTVIKTGFGIEKNTIKDIVDYQNKTGGKFTIATGRSDEMCKSVIDTLHVTMPVISCNGALIRNPLTKEVLFTECVDNKIAYDCIMQAARLNLDICAYDANSIIVTKKSNRYLVWNDINKSQPDKYKVAFTFFDSLEDMADAVKNGKLKILKLLIDCSVDHRDKEAENIFDQFDDLNMTWSGNDLLDAMKKGVSKQTGIAHLGKILNVNPQKNIVCIGDNYNDLGMVEYVDKGVAIGNAVEPLKKVAYYVTDTIDNNGVGHVLEKILNKSF